MRGGSDPVQNGSLPPDLSFLCREFCWTGCQKSLTAWLISGPSVKMWQLRKCRREFLHSSLRHRLNASIANRRGAQANDQSRWGGSDPRVTLATAQRQKVGSLHPTRCFARVQI